MEAQWTTLFDKVATGIANKTEEKLYRQWGKAMALLSANPKHPGLNSHEIEPLSRRYGKKVWQSYLENRTPAAGRLFWVYGPGKKEITILGLEPHPEDRKQSGYARVRLSAEGDIEPEKG